MIAGIILASIIISSFFFGAQAAASPDTTEVEQEQVQEVKTLFTEQELTSLVNSSADKYGVSRVQLLTTVKCEAKKVLVDGVVHYDATAKSDHPGEESYGLAQWNLPSKNTNFEGEVITHAQATDAEYSLDLMASYFSKGKKSKWSCYRIHYGRT